MTSPGEEHEGDLAAPRVGRVPADTLSNRLTLARKLAGLSIRDAADLCGYGRGAWTNWEKGARPLDLLEVTGQVAEKLDVDLDWLRFGGHLAGPQGTPVAKKVKKSPVRSADEDSLTTPRQADRLAGHGPKGRADQTRPVSPVGVTGRRPVRVGAARVAEGGRPMVINLG